MWQIQTSLEIIWEQPESKPGLDNTKKCEYYGAEWPLASYKYPYTAILYIEKAPSSDTCRGGPTEIIINKLEAFVFFSEVWMHMSEVVVHHSAHIHQQSSKCHNRSDSGRKCANSDDYVSENVGSWRVICHWKTSQLNPYHGYCCKWKMTISRLNSLPSCWLSLINWRTEGRSGCHMCQ